MGFALVVMVAACGGDGGEGGELAAPEEGSAVDLSVWSMSNEVEHWRSDAPAQVAEDITTWDVTVEAVNDSSGWDDYKRKYTLAADAGDAPEIVVSGHEDVAVWGQAGYVIPFGECRDAYPEFDDVIEGLWDSATWDGQVWGVPQDTEARPMYYNKEKLAELGWSQEEIDSLPQRIQDGEFTLDDMIDTAKAAVDQGVVEPGYGYWHRPTEGGDFLQYYVAYGGRLYDEEEDKLVVNRQAVIDWYAFQRRVVEEGITPENYIGTESEVWHDIVSGGQALFWNGGVWNWSDWATNYVADQGGQEHLFSFIGYALQPSGIEGEEGVTLSHPLIYMLSSSDASAADSQAPACEVLAKTTTAEINTLHAVESTHLGIVNAQADYPDYANDKLLSETLYMLDYNFYQPNHVAYGPYFTALYENMVSAENGDATPEEAADQAIAVMEAEIPDQILIEE
ncbi:MAG: extracellular solute-binding protein [Acidimicrobiia bacterium]|nr:extracellular solute-binding protein [Acidimicrobiia bacterium]